MLNNQSNQEFLQKIGSTLVSTDRSDVVKVAGILRSLKNWYKGLFNPEYKEKVLSMKRDSKIITVYLDKLEKNIKRLENAISENDVDLYNYVLDEVEHTSFALSEALKAYGKSVSEYKIPQKPEEKKELRIKFSEKVTDSFKKEISESLSKIGVSDEEITKIVSDSSLALIVEKEIRKGLVSFVQDVDKSEKSKDSSWDRIGETWKTINTEVFKLGNYPFKVQLELIVTDLSQRKNNPQNIWAVMRVENVFLEKTSFAKTAATIARITGLEEKSAKFIEELNNVGHRLGIDPAWLAAIMKSESGFNPAIRNPKGGATGLIQFTPSTSRYLGTSISELAKMSDVEQLKYVERFYAPRKGRIRSPGDLYMATFLPIFVGSPENTVIGQKGNFNKMKGGLTYNQVYIGNSGLDSDKDGKILVSDVTSRVNGILSNAQKVPPISFYGEQFNKKEQPESLKGKRFEIEPVKVEEQGIFSKIYDKLMSFFRSSSVSNQYGSIIKKACYEQVLPKNKIKIKIASDDFSKTASYAYILSEAVDRTLLADSNFYTDGISIEIVSELSGSIEATASAIIGVNEIIKQAFIEKYNETVSTRISSSESTLNCLKDSEIEKHKRKFVLKNIKENHENLR